VISKGKKKYLSILRFLKTPQTDMMVTYHLSPLMKFSVRMAPQISVDVRTSAEWAFVGVPDVSSINHETKFISWQIFPEMSLNADFINMLEVAITNKTPPVLFLCRSGARSASAARIAKANGYEASFNIAGGFEGDANSEHHRGGVNGWKSDNLPWVQQ
jgi:rhodanese-related sulfurtransferase